MVFLDQSQAFQVYAPYERANGYENKVFEIILVNTEIIITATCNFQMRSSYWEAHLNQDNNLGQTLYLVKFTFHFLY